MQSSPVLSSSLSNKREQFAQLKDHLNQRIIGQEKLILRLLIALILMANCFVKAPGFSKNYSN